MQFLRREKIKIRQVHHLDRHLGEYLDILSFKKGSLYRQLATSYPASSVSSQNSKITLHIAAQFHRNWQRLHVPVRATPIPHDLLEALAVLCLSSEEPALAIMLLLAFRCFLRTNEMLHLQWNHLLTLPDQQCLNVVLSLAKHHRATHKC